MTSSLAVKLPCGLGARFASALMTDPKDFQRAPDQLDVASSRGGGELYRVLGLGANGDPIGLWTSLHGLLPPRPRRARGIRPWICAELVGHAGRVALQLWVPDGQAPFVAA